MWMRMQSKLADVYFCSLGCCDWYRLQFLLFIVLQLHTWISTRVAMKCIFPKCLLCQDVYSQNVHCAKMSTPKCPLCQNVYSQNVYCAKMSTPKMSTWQKCPLPKCLLSRLNPEGPFGKEISLIHKKFSRHFGSLLKTLQPVLTVYNEFVFWKMYDF